ncbi:hypothetical protein ABLV66_19250, partial [Klebsiella sp. CN_Kp073]|uniref:hypothetical protein n=1 Tax=Klebsiella sp. CN_Kp073 TaxID=3153412 RepID=UPI0032B39880
PATFGSPAKRSASRGMSRMAALRALPGRHNPRRSVARLSVAQAGGCPGWRRFAPCPGDTTRDVR